MEFTKDVTTYSAFQTYRVRFPEGGEARIVATDANHLHFDANHHSLNGRPGDRCWIVCRGIEYGASVHFQRIDGEWKVIDRPYTSRVATSKDASPAAVLWITKTMLQIVREFAAQHPEVFTAAQVSQVTRDLENKREELFQMKRKVAELEAQILELENARNVSIGLDLDARGRAK